MRLRLPLPKVAPPLLPLKLYPLLPQLQASPRISSRFFSDSLYIYKLPTYPTRPPQLAQQRQQQQGAPGGGGGPNPLGGAAGAGGQGQEIDFEAMRNSPQMQQLREMIAQNPNMLQPIIQQLAATNPALAQVMAQNPDALYQLLGGEEGGEDGPLPSGAHVVHVTPEEQAAIERVRTACAMICDWALTFAFVAPSFGIPAAGSVGGVFCV